MVAITELGGKHWESSDKLTGPIGKTNLNAAQKQGLVWSTESHGLFIEIEPLKYLKPDYSLESYAGTGGIASAVPGNEAAVYVYINDSNTVVINDTGFPTDGSFYVALALLATSGTNVLSVTNIQQMAPTVDMSGMVASVTGTAPISVDNTDPQNPVISMPAAASGSPGTPGHMTAAQVDKLAGIEALADVTDAANVTAAGALMKSLFAAQGGLAVGTGTPGAPTQLSPGAAGTFLKSQGAGADLIWQTISAFASEVWIGNMTAVGSNPLGLGYDVYQLSEFATAGDIAIDAGGYKIDVPNAGKYVGITLNRFDISTSGELIQRPRLPAGTILSNGKKNPGTVAGDFDDIFVLPFFFETAGGEEFHIEVSSSFGLAGGNNENILIIFKISD